MVKYGALNPLAVPKQQYPGKAQGVTLAAPFGAQSPSLTSSDSTFGLSGTSTTPAAAAPPTFGAEGAGTTPYAPPKNPFITDPNAQPGQPGYDLFQGYDDLGQLFFNQHPDQAWSHAWSQLAPNSAAPWWNWGRQQEGRYEDRYTAESALPGNANLTFSDFINRHAPEFRTEFDNLPANQRGVNLFWMPQGRLG